MIFGSISFVGNFVLQGFRDELIYYVWYFPPNALPFVAFIIIHYLIVIQPVITEMKDKNALNPAKNIGNLLKPKNQLHYSTTDFMKCLTDPALFQKLEQCCIEEFSVENVLFWLAYYDISKNLYLILLEDLAKNEKLLTVLKLNDQSIGQQVANILTVIGLQDSEISHLMKELQKEHSDDAIIFFSNIGK